MDPQETGWWVHRWFEEHIDISFISVCDLSRDTREG
jgi:hypothetical protein